MKNHCWKRKYEEISQQNTQNLKIKNYRRYIKQVEKLLVLTILLLLLLAFVQQQVVLLLIWLRPRLLAGQVDQNFPSSTTNTRTKTNMTPTTTTTAITPPATFDKIATPTVTIQQKSASVKINHKGTRNRSKDFVQVSLLLKLNWYFPEEY